MIAGALGVSFRQALRSVVLTLFPLAFISLFAWATAGSITGNTSDPVRASAWLYLAAHLVPFHVTTGRLTFLPLLAVIYPMWAIRRGLPKVTEAFTKLNGARTMYALWYAGMSEAIAALSRYHGIAPNLYLTPVITFVIALIATHPFQIEKSRAFYLALYLFSICLGIGAIAFGYSLAIHVKQVESILVVLSPGVYGSVLMVLLQFLYLPNIALASLSYITGINITFGAQTFIGASKIKLLSVPALPFVPALPTVAHPFLKYALGFWFVLFVVIAIFVLRRSSSVAELAKELALTGVKFLIFIAAISYFASGELLTPALNPVGVIWWKFSATLAITYVTAGLLVMATHLLLQQLIHRSSRALNG